MKGVIVALALVLAAAPAMAQPDPDLKLSGPHWQFNIIGHPKGISGDESGGRAVMIPLKNATGPNEIVCEDQEVLYLDDSLPTYDKVPAGARIYFEPGDTFEIIDRDATDGTATIQVPVDGDQITFDIYLRVLGKPNTCMDINAFAYDATQQLYFWAGSVDLNRKTGKATWVKVNYLFDVFWCDVDPVTNLCIAGTTVEYSVFNDVFQDYFWSILNNGTRLVQVRLYPKPTQQ